MDVPLPAEIGLGPLHRFRQRSGFDGESGLARTMLVPGVVTNGLEKAYVE